VVLREGGDVTIVACGVLVADGISCAEAARIGIRATAGFSKVPGGRPPATAPRRDHRGR